VRKGIVTLLLLSFVWPLFIPLFFFQRLISLFFKRKNSSPSIEEAEEIVPKKEKELEQAKFDKKVLNLFLDLKTAEEQQKEGTKER
jgi:hypothetical protein